MKNLIKNLDKKVNFESVIKYVTGRSVRWNFYVKSTSGSGEKQLYNIKYVTASFNRNVVPLL